MPRNRVEELEATVDDLQATINGLTEELVEVKHRLAVVESRHDIDHLVASERHRPRRDVGVGLDNDDIIVS